MNPCFFALHGFTGSGDDFDSLRRNFPSHWLWHCPDLPGHGQNPTTPIDDKHTLDQHLEFLESERQKTFGDTPCVLIGYSMGGRIALQWALQNPAPFSAIILIGASPGIADETSRLARIKSDHLLAKKIREHGVPRFQERWWKQPVLAGLRHLPPAQFAALRLRRLKNSADGLAASLHGVGTGELPSLWHRLPEITLPTLLLTGKHDAKFSAIISRMAQHIPNAKTAKIPRSGHVAHLEQPGETAKEILHFVNKVCALDK